MKTYVEFAPYKCIILILILILNCVEVCIEGSSPGLSCGWVNYVGCIEDTLFS